MKFQVSLHDSDTGNHLSAVLSVDPSKISTDKASEIKYHMEIAVHELFASLNIDNYHYSGDVMDMNDKKIGVQNGSFIDLVYDDDYALPGDCPDFRSWLEQRDAFSIVGVTEDGERCPIQQWILKTTGKNVFVGAEYVEGVERFGLPVRYSLPYWASSFIRELDHSFKGSVFPRDAIAVIEINDLC